MNKVEKNANLLKVKLALAEKYDRLGKATTSRPRQKTYLYHAAKFRRQAADLAMP